mmetsp:Transcript_1096/g.2643  ORF Transcript_1096/g.2643 Transcript_1096/m.2643 type:complete len:128 (-) Transcript_1096:14-397(-)
MKPMTTRKVVPVPKAQRKYDDAEMCEALQRITATFKELNELTAKRFPDYTRYVPPAMRDPQATVDDFRRRESIFDNPEFERTWSIIEQAYGIESDEDCKRIGFDPSLLNIKSDEDYRRIGFDPSLLK